MNLLAVNSERHEPYITFKHMPNYRLNKIENDVLFNNVEKKNKVLPFHIFLVNALRAGSIHPSLETMANLPVPLF